MGFKRDGVTMVFVSHSMEDVTRICDRVMWIEEHKVKMIEEPQKGIKNYCKV